MTLAEAEPHYLWPLNHSINRPPPAMMNATPTSHEIMPAPVAAARTICAMPMASTAPERTAAALNRDPIAGSDRVGARFPGPPQRRS